MTTLHTVPLHLRVSGVSGRAEHSAWVLGRLYACLKRCSLQNTAPSGVHPAPSRGCLTTPVDRIKPHSTITSESLWRLWACRAFSMGPRQAARMPQTLQSSKYSPIGGARCTLSRVLDRTSPVHEEAPRSMVNLRVSGVWACRAFSLGPRQAACMPQSLESRK